MELHWQWGANLTMSPRVSIVIPAFEEGDSILPVLQRISDSVKIDFEVLVVVDSETDSTVNAVETFDGSDERFSVCLNTLGPGPANAIKSGVTRSNADVIVVTMADGSDDAAQIEVLTRLVERGVAIASASRYMKGGSQVGAPLLKALLSRTAGLSLYYLARVGTRDATNSYKAYSAVFLDQVGIDSEKGFEIALELVAKARRNRLQVVEIPTIWLEREVGVSRFKIVSWLSAYLKWYLYAFRPKIRTHT